MENDEVEKQKTKKKLPLTPAEKQKRYRERFSEKIKEKDRERKRGQRSNLKNDAILWREYRLKENERIRKSRISKAEKAKVDTESSPYRCPQSLGRALKRVTSVLPKSPRKRRKVVTKLFQKEKDLIENNDKNTKRQGHTQLDIETQNLVLKFYDTEVSWQAPGFKDRVIIRDNNGNKTYVQKKYMLYSLKEAHQLFLKENENHTISLSKFCSLRPSHIFTFSHVPHNVCVCTTHENIHFLLQALNLKNSSVPTEFHTFIDLIVCNSEQYICMNQECNDCKDKFDSLFSDYERNDNRTVDYYQWCKIENKIEKQKLNGTYDELVTKLKSKLKQFLIHTYVKRAQSTEFEKLKNSVDGKSVLIQVDFAENFTLKDQNQIQSAHWVNKQCTLFTVFMWIDQSCSKGMTIISDHLEHGKYAVHKFITFILQFLTEFYENVREVTFFSDGPSSQFKQRYLFSNLQFWSEQYKIEITWQYFATSHGKGVIDGIGGTVKRSVWHRILCGEHVQCAEDFARVAKKVNPNVIIKYISSAEIQQDITYLDERWAKVRLIPGTQSIHKVMSCGDGLIKVSMVATGDLITHKIRDQVDIATSIQDVDHELNVQNNVKCLVPSDWVIVKYDGNFFPGEVVQIIENDIEVSTMCRHGDSWTWPQVPDKIFYNRSNVVRKIDSPLIQMKGMRLFFTFPNVKELI